MSGKAQTWLLRFGLVALALVQAWVLHPAGPRSAAPRQATTQVQP